MDPGAVDHRDRSDRFGLSVVVEDDGGFAGTAGHRAHERGPRIAGRGRRAGFVQEGVVRGCLDHRDGIRGDAALLGRLPGD